MANFAVIKDGVVDNYIVSDSKETAEEITGLTCIESNSAYIGLPYVDGAFVFPSLPQPYPSWTKDSEGYRWNAPTPYPTDGKFYYWSEDDLSWRINNE
jgi:hypothetical protein